MLADGTTRAVALGATDRRSRSRVGAEPPPALSLVERDGVAGAAWAAAATCEQRVHPHDAAGAVAGRRPGLGRRSPKARARAVRGDRGGRRGSSCGRDHATRAAVGRCWRWPGTGAVSSMSSTVATSRAARWRGLHVDLARQFVPAADVEWLIEVAAWHGLNRLHLHLTDDEGWRLTVPGYPALTDVGGVARPWAAPCRRCSAPAPIPRAVGTRPGRSPAWVDRAGELGIEVVPEVDLPGHCFAALAGASRAARSRRRVGCGERPALRRQRAQPGCRRDVAVPRGGVRRAGRPFPVAVAAPRRRRGAAWGMAAFTCRAAVGCRAGDRRHRCDRRIVPPPGHRRSCGPRPGGRSACGRRPPRAARWIRATGTSSAGSPSTTCRRLVPAGHEVVAAPAPWYYLDHAADDGWWSPGASWAGQAPLDDVDAFRCDRRLVGRGARRTARHPSLPLDRARPRPRHPPPPPPPAPHPHRRRRLDAT